MKLWFIILKTILFISSLFINVTLHSQSNDSTNNKKSPLQVRGYVKDLQTLTFDKNFNNLIAGNLIHNRLNLRYNPSSNFSMAMEMRNRLFWGEEVKVTPGFSDYLRNPNEYFNLSFLWIDNPGLVLHTNIDRMWFQYKSNKLEARLGRQRINWGIGTIWNPNDIFNTYNFLDFDYEERPGRDAVKITYLLSEMSNIELAAAASKETKQSVAAIKYFFNKYNYDFQFNGGLFHETFTFGAGWSGSIGDSGFKGELQYFTPHKDTAGLVNFTMEADYLFDNGWYLNGGILFNSNGYNQPIDNWESVSFQFSPQSLMPTKWNTVLTFSKQISPLVTGTLSTIYSPGTNLLILLPTLKYNLATNLDVDFVMQSFFAEQQDTFDGVSHRIFLRAKWNF
jgi:hypothetical protein